MTAASTPHKSGQNQNTLFVHFTVGFEATTNKPAKVG